MNIKHSNSNRGRPKPKPRILRLKLRRPKRILRLKRICHDYTLILQLQQKHDQVEHVKIKRSGKMVMVPIKQEQDSYHYHNFTNPSPIPRVLNCKEMHSFLYNMVKRYRSSFAEHNFLIDITREAVEESNIVIVESNVFNNINDHHRYSETHPMVKQYLNELLIESGWAGILGHNSYLSIDGCHIVLIRDIEDSSLKRLNTALKAHGKYSYTEIANHDVLGLIQSCGRDRSVPQAMRMRNTETEIKMESETICGRPASGQDHDQAECDK